MYFEIVAGGFVSAARDPDLTFTIPFQPLVSLCQKSHDNRLLSEPTESAKRLQLTTLLEINSLANSKISAFLFGSNLFSARVIIDNLGFPLKKSKLSWINNQ